MRAPPLLQRTAVAHLLLHRAVDIWSVGCILAEMVLRRPLFEGVDNYTQLMAISGVLGKPPDDYIASLK